jgi:hypothetical protein
MFKLTLIKIILITLVFKNVFAGESSSIDKVNNTQYKSAFDTFYNYIEIVNKKGLSLREVQQLFNPSFCLKGNPNIVMESYEDIHKFYSSIRNEIYPKICYPYKFVNLKLHKLCYLPLTESSVKIGLLDVFETTPNRTPRFKMCFIYDLVRDSKTNKWLMNGLQEVRVKNYPKQWKQIDVRSDMKYDLNRPISALKPLLASKIQ